MPQRFDCGTVIHWGQLRLQNCHISSFDQDVRMDDTNSDSMFTTFKISIETIVHESNVPLGVIDPTLDPINAVDKLGIVQAYLMHNRQVFEMYFEGVRWIRVTPHISPVINGVPVWNRNGDAASVYRGEVDVNNGPKCTSCRVTHVAGRKAFRIQATFEISVLTCRVVFDEEPGKPGLDGLFLLNNRWSLDESIDNEWHWTRTITGKCRVAHAELWQTRIRYLLIPRLSPFYQLESMTFVQSTDALSMQYSIVMRSRHAAPPYPAIDWEGEHSEETGLGGGTGKSSLTIRLTGAPHSSKQDLFIAAIAVAEARIGYLNQNLDDENAGSFWVTGCSTTDIMHTNQLTFSVSLERAFSSTIEKSKNDGGKETSIDSYLGVTWSMLEKWPMAPSEFGGPLANYRPDAWPEPIPMSDEGPANMFRRMFFSPCLEPIGAAWTEVLYPDYPEHHENNGLVEAEEVKPKVMRGDAEIEMPAPTGEHRVSADHAKNMYRHAEIHSQYFIDHNVFALPKIIDYDASNRTDSDSVLVRAARPTTTWWFTYRAEQVGKKPRIPKAIVEFTDKNGIYYMLDEEEIKPGCPILSADGGMYSYTLECRFVYKLSRRPTVGDTVWAGALPWDSSGKDDNAWLLDDDAYSEDII